MPFVQRVVEPKFLSRRSLHADDGQPIVTDYELEAVTNNTLSSALRQLASLVLIANDIFEDLRKQLQDVSERSKRLQNRIVSVEGKVMAFDPRKVTVRKYILNSTVYLLILCSMNLVLVVYFCVRKKVHGIFIEAGLQTRSTTVAFVNPLGCQIMVGYPFSSMSSRFFSREMSLL
jgi:hypothetical protein